MDSQPKSGDRKPDGSTPVVAQPSYWSDGSSDRDEYGNRSGSGRAIPDVREIYSRWVDHNYEELQGAFDALKSWLHDTIATIMFRMDFETFCQFAYESSKY
jgi:hypothetical protein